MFHPGDVLRKWRNKRGIGLVELAKLSNVDKGTISKIENGGSYRQPTFEKLCAAFGKTPIDVYAELVEGVTKTSTEQSSACPTRDPEHEKYHSLLESILHSNDQKCINAIVAILEAVARNYPDRSTGGHSAIREVELFRAAEDQAPYNSSRTERQHGPFDTTKLPIPGVSEIEFKDPILKKKRK